jgi:hypothetical protein
MNGILPAPCTSMPQLLRSARRSGDSSAWAARGSANKPSTEGAITVPSPAVSPWAMKSRRDTGRLCAPVCRMGSSSPSGRGFWRRISMAMDLRRWMPQWTSVTALPSSAAQVDLTTVSVRPVGQLLPQEVRRVISWSSSVRISAGTGSVYRF